MKKILFAGIKLCLLIVLLPSCASIIGGGKYNAVVKVNNNPNAQIEYEGKLRGTGVANFSIFRRDANKLEFTIKQDGCETETHRFTKRKFRGWSFFFTLVGWTGVTVNGAYLPIPFGVIVDGANGAWWKPDPYEAGVSKANYKNYSYTIDYKGCETKTAE